MVKVILPTHKKGSNYFKKNKNKLSFERRK